MITTCEKKIWIMDNGDTCGGNYGNVTNRVLMGNEWGMNRSYN
jgi:hypothetical protein